MPGFHRHHVGPDSNVALNNRDAASGPKVCVQFDAECRGESGAWRRRMTMTPFRQQTLDSPANRTCRRWDYRTTHRFLDSVRFDPRCSSESAAGWPFRLARRKLRRPIDRNLAISAKRHAGRRRIRRRTVRPSPVTNRPGAPLAMSPARSHEETSQRSRLDVPQEKGRRARTARRRATALRSPPGLTRPEIRS
jgi:hypothetical protein